MRPTDFSTFVGIGIGCVIIGLILVFHEQLGLGLPIGDATPTARIVIPPIPTDPSQTVEETEEGEQALEQVASEEPPLPPPLSVHSIPVSNQYSVLDWNASQPFSGYVDTVYVDDVLSEPNQPISVTTDSVVRLNGWAGNAAFGVQFPWVLFSVCDLVVGSTPVLVQRPDVQENVHKNLEVTGWEATLAARHFPVCEDATLIAWGVAPIGFNIFPLYGGRVIDHVPGEETPPKYDFVSPDTILSPKDVPPPTEMSISVLASSLNVRRCASSDCPIVGAFKRGRYDGFLIDTNSEWSLVQAADTVGWVYNQFVDLE